MAFAKLYERDGRQVLAFADKDSEGDPAVKIVFETESGNRCTLAFGYEKASKRDAEFAKMTEESIFDIVDEASKGMPL